MSDDSARGHTQNSADAGEQISAERLASLSDELLQEEKVAGEEYRHDQKYASPYISIEQSSAADVVAGTMYKTVHVYAARSDPAAVAVDQVAERDTHKVRAVYVKPRMYDRAQRLLEERRVLALWGEAAYGKATTALHLLLERSGAIARLDPTVELEQLQGHAFDASQGYLIDTLAPESAQRLNVFTLSALSSRLRDKSSYLIITVDGKTSLDRSELSDYLVQWRERPACAAVLERHLDWLIPEGDHLARNEGLALIAEPAVQQFLGSNPSLRSISELAILLKQVIDGDLALDEAVQQLSFFALTQVQDWFKNPARTMPERSLMIALAAFSGSRLSTTPTRS
jgi:hypothetical protein